MVASRSGTKYIIERYNAITRLHRDYSLSISCASLALQSTLLTVVLFPTPLCLVAPTPLPAPDAAADRNPGRATDGVLTEGACLGPGDICGMLVGFTPSPLDSPRLTLRNDGGIQAPLGVDATVAVQNGRGLTGEATRVLRVGVPCAGAGHEIACIHVSYHGRMGICRTSLTGRQT